MAMDSKQLLEEVIIPTLQFLGMDSESARNLLLGTAAQESHMATYIRQLGRGPALGIYQMEPATHDDIWENYLAYRPSLAKKLELLLVPGFSKLEQLTFNLAYATAMTRLHYRRVPKALPAANELGDQAMFWKQYYNTWDSKGTIVEYEKNWERFAA